MTTVVTAKDERGPAIEAVTPVSIFYANGMWARWTGNPC